MLEILISLVLAYLLGSIPTAVWIGRWLYDTDVREHGSGNAGATNTIRVLGVKVGVPVLLIDVFKGFLAVYIAGRFSRMAGFSEPSPYHMVAAAALAVIGHTLPIFAGFRGGKGVATLLGVGIGLFPAAAWTALGVFIVVVSITRYVSLASISAGISFPLLIFFVFPPSPPHWLYYILGITVALFLPYTHRKNIRRLLNGTESKLTFKTKEKK